MLMNVGDKTKLKNLGEILDGMEVEILQIGEDEDGDELYCVKLLETRKAYVEGEWLDVSKYNLQ